MSTTTTVTTTSPHPTRPSRPPTASKYRSSCDACQTAKVKCGQEKRSCHRCVIQGIECVYSLSRRMGRPRKAIKPVAPPAAAPTPAAAAATEPAPCRTPVSTPEAERNMRLAHALSQPTPPRDRVGAESMEAIDPMDLVLEEVHRLPSPPSLSSTAAPEVGNYLTDAEMQPSLEDFDFTVPGGFGMGGFDVDFNVFDTFAYPEETSAGEAGPDAIFAQEELTFSPRSGGKQLDDQPTIGGMPLKSPWEEDARNAFDNDLTSTSRLSSSLNLFPDITTNPMTTSTDPRPSHPSPLWPGFSFSPSTTPKDPTPRSKSQTDCPCYALILRAVGTLTHTPPDTPSPIDHVLGVERDMHALLARLHRCKPCSRDRTALLLAFISTTKTLDLLERAAHLELRPARRPASFHAPASSAGGSSVSSTAAAAAAVAAAGGPTQTQPRSCALLVGAFEVAERGRTRFLRRVFQTRFAALVALLRGLQSGLGVVMPQDAVGRAGGVMAGDLLRSLETLAGWMELWSNGME